MEDHRHIVLFRQFVQGEMALVVGIDQAVAQVNLDAHALGRLEHPLKFLGGGPAVFFGQGVAVHPGAVDDFLGLVVMLQVKGPRQIRHPGHRAPIQGGSQGCIAHNHGHDHVIFLAGLQIMLRRIFMTGLFGQLVKARGTVKVHMPIDDFHDNSPLLLLYFVNSLLGIHRQKLT